MERQRGQGTVGLWIVALLAIVLIGGAFLYLTRTDNGTVPDSNNANGERVWETYENSQYDFSISYPANDWQFASTTDRGGLSPLFNAYIKPAGVPVADITHHANITNVSVFPEGIPTEGLFGETVELGFNPGFAVSEGRMYVLDDGTPFAAYIRPANPPESWAEAGFVWMRVRMDDAETQCYDEDGELVPEASCDPLTGSHTIEWSGTVDSSQWNTARDIVQRIEL